MEKLPASNSIIQADPWSSLRKLSPARIGLGNTGGVIPLKDVLALKMAHAHARDAVYASLDEKNVLAALRQFSLPVIHASSCAKNREQYLLDPGLGRKLDQQSVVCTDGSITAGGIVLIVSDGLSATAVNSHAIPVLQTLVPLLKNSGRKINSLCMVCEGRVAIGDEIAGWTKADMSVILIGERPGLSAADSLGVYLTFNPRPGLTDESRNCISNIHPAGLDYATAAKKIMYLISESFRLGLSGVALKEEQNLPG